MSNPTTGENRFTGRHMLAIMVAFFGVIITVNVTMAVLANTTWSGFVVRNSYVAGLEFNRKAEEARKQDELGWASQVAVSDGTVIFSLSDAEGDSVYFNAGTATFRRPTTDTEDATVKLLPGPGGTLVAPVALRNGSWIIELNASARQDTPWHEMTRILLREGQMR